MKTVTFLKAKTSTSVVTVLLIYASGMAQDALPEAFVGSWTGFLHHVAWNVDFSFYATLQAGVTGDSVGTFEYSQPPCGSFPGCQ